MAQPLMPKATAVWLIENTSLTFEQIGEFCGLHPLEVKGIADGDVAQGIKGLDPVATGQITREQLEKAQADPSVKLELAPSGHEDIVTRKRRRGPRYTPLSRRQDRPDAIYWMIRNHPEVSDAQIAKLIGTTKPTIQSIRDRTHWNSANLKPVDPVALGLCTQIELDEVVRKAAARKARAEERARKAAIKAGTIKPTEETLAETADASPAAAAEAPTAEIYTKPEELEAPEKSKNYDAESVFSGLNAKPDSETEDASDDSTGA